MVTGFPYNSHEGSDKTLIPKHLSPPVTSAKPVTKGVSRNTLWTEKPPDVKELD